MHFPDPSNHIRPSNFLHREMLPLGARMGINGTPKFGVVLLGK